MATKFANDWNKMCNPYRGPSIYASYQDRFIWPSGFRGGDVLEIEELDSRIGCGRYVLTDRDKMSNHYRGPYIDVAYQISVHLTKRRFQRGIFIFEKQTNKIEIHNTTQNQ